jgi:hypothetical protein
MSDALSYVTKRPLSENANSDGTDEPIIMTVQRASRLKGTESFRLFSTAVQHLCK